ncbi:MAG: hypothetical protein PHW87_06895 [Methanothrix sp.]|nr:hypothetical protein [Methanothrix sp.]
MSKIASGIVLFSLLMALSLGVAFAESEVAETNVTENVTINVTENVTINATENVTINATENVTVETTEVKEDA